MRLLLPVILLTFSCNNTSSTDLKSKKWQLYSMTAKNPNHIGEKDNIMIDAFAQDTSRNKVFVDFNSDTTTRLFINSSKPMNPTGTKYRSKGDTLFLEGPEAHQKDTILIIAQSKDILHVYSLRGIDYKFKNIK